MCFDRLFLCFTQFCGGFHCLNYDSGAQWIISVWLYNSVITRPYFRPSASRGNQREMSYFRSVAACIKLAFEQALLFGLAKRASRERASEGPSAPRGLAARSRVLARPVSLAQRGELARRLALNLILDFHIKHN